MNSTVAHLEQVVSDLDMVLSGFAAGDAALRLVDADRLEVLRAAGDVFRRVEAVIVEAVASADRAEFAHRAGCRSVNELVQRTIRVDSAGAGRVVKAADAVRREVELTTGVPLPARWPALRAALLDGVVGIAGLLAATGPIDQARSRIGTAERLCVDEILADHARGCPPAPSRGDESITGDRADDSADGESARPATGTDADAGEAQWAPPATPDDLRILSQDLAVVLDPDGAEPSDRSASDGRFLTFGRLRNGRYPLRGSLLPEVFAQLQLLMDATLNPKTDGPPVPAGVVFTETDPDQDGDAASSGDGGSGGDGDADGGGDGVDGGEDPFNSDPRNVIDTRTRAQKQHDVLAAILGIAARHHDTPTLGGAAPTLVVQINATDLTGSAIHDNSDTGDDVYDDTWTQENCGTHDARGTYDASGTYDGATGDGTDGPSVDDTGGDSAGGGHADPTTQDGYGNDGRGDTGGTAARRPGPGAAFGPAASPSAGRGRYQGERGWARIPGIEIPVSPVVARQVACSGTIQRVLFDEGRIIGITVTDRIFTAHQRRAIVARDKECLIPGCHVPAAWCEIHHVTEHARGGPTSTSNGVPLCWWHHRTLDHSGWQIRMRNGLPEIRGPAWWDPHRAWRTPRPSHTPLPLRT